MPKLYLGFLASHGGSNMQSIINACIDGSLNAKPCVCISNNSGSYALQRARELGIPTYHLSSKQFIDDSLLDEAILKVLIEHNVDTVILAGFMKKLGKKVLYHFKGRILNIHPALLPKYGGKGMYGIHVHESVLTSGDKISGATVHLVDEEYDCGRILLQKTVSVLPEDTPESLAERVLIQEHLLYPETLRKIAEGEIEL